MTPLQLSKIIARKKLRRVDAAWLIGTTMRHLRYLLSGEKPIPQYVAPADDRLRPRHPDRRLAGKAHHGGCPRLQYPF